MIEELNSMGIEVMVSIWPTVDYRSENFQEMLEKGYLVRTEKGVRVTMQFMGQEVFMDSTHPEAREYVWQKAKENPLNLIRCAWAGNQRYGALLWSGDIDSTYKDFQRQLRAGLSASMAGIPWFTTDIGGFHSGDIKDPEFKELLMRWFQYGCFSPVFRLHGNREPGNLGNVEIGESNP